MGEVAQSLAVLREKYVAIKRLRDAAADGTPIDPRAEMIALSRRFPGALRELDELPMCVIEQRLGQLDAALAKQGPAPEWVLLQLGYHGWMRVALRIKRMAVGSDERVDAILVQLAASYQPAAFEPALEHLDRAAIEAILKPAGGRLNPWVFRCVAAVFGVEPGQVQRALFLPRRGR